MFERFTSDARDVVVRSRSEARRLGHDSVGSEHLLLALIARSAAVAAVLQSHGVTGATVEADIAAVRRPPTGEDDRTALASLGIDLDRVQGAVESAFGPDAFSHGGAAPRRRWRRPRRPSHGRASGYVIPFTPRAKKCLELSLREAVRLGHNAISAEHVALGILREGQGLACQVLARRKVSPAALRASLEAALRQAA